MATAKKLEAVPTATDTLREAIRSREVEREKMEALAADVNRMQSAQHAEADAQAAFDALLAQDAAALTEWAATGAQGPAPQPDHAQRQQVAQRLADAQHAAKVEAIARQACETRYMQQHPRYVEAVAAVTEAAAEVMAERMLAAQEAHRAALDHYHAAEQRSEAFVAAVQAARTAARAPARPGGLRCTPGAASQRRHRPPRTGRARHGSRDLGRTGARRGLIAPSGPAQKLSACSSLSRAPVF